MLTGPSFIPDNIKQAVILCHGYGSNGADMAGLIPHLAKALPHTGFFCPNAPVPMMYDGYEWFSLSDYTGIPEMANKQYLDELVSRCKAPAQLLFNYIENIKNTYGLSDTKIILGGFSQGGLMALYTALTKLCHIGGVIGCSAVPIVFDTALPADKIKCTFPVLLTHGKTDDVVPVYGADMTKSELKTVGINADIVQVEGLGHGIDAHCLEKMTAFISDIFSKN